MEQRHQSRSHRRRPGPAESLALAAWSAAAAVCLIVASLARSNPRRAADPVPATAPLDADPPTPLPAVERDGFKGAVDRFQRRHTALAFPIAVLLKYDRDRGMRHGALIAYYGFFSLFPAMLALTTILRFVMADRPEFRQDIANSAISQFPVLGDTVAQSATQPLSGNAIALTIGVAGAIWAGLGAMGAAQDMLNDIWAVPREDHPNFLWRRIRSLLMLFLIVVLLVASTIGTQLVVVVVPGTWTTTALFASTVAANIFVFVVAFLVLAIAKLGWKDVLPGAVFAGIFYTGLQLLATAFVTSTVRNVEDAYGTFVVVLGLMSWIYLLAQMATIATCVNVVASRHQWPRSLFAGLAPDT